MKAAEPLCLSVPTFRIKEQMYLLNVQKQLSAPNPSCVVRDGLRRAAGDVYL